MTGLMIFSKIMSELIKINDPAVWRAGAQYEWGGSLVNFSTMTKEEKVSLLTRADFMVEKDKYEKGLAVGWFIFREQPDNALYEILYFIDDAIVCRKAKEDVDIDRSSYDIYIGKLCSQ